MNVIRISERKGTEARGTCTECGKESREDQEILKIRFDHLNQAFSCVKDVLKLCIMLLEHGLRSEKCVHYNLM